MKKYVKFGFNTRLTRNVSLYYRFNYHIYTVSQKKNKQNCFYHNFLKFPPILIIFGKTIANSVVSATVIRS